MICALDLCCGAGGWACAARGLPIRWACVADHARDCLETWRINHAADHPGCRVLLADLASDGGAESVVAACRGHRIDLVVGGIPCEQVSIARGANRETAPNLALWHGLMDRLFGLVKELEPRWWVFEDVIQVEKHLPPPIEFGRDYGRRRLEARDHGPQDRIRTFVGHFPPPAPPEPGPRTLGECLRPGPHLAEPSQGRYEPVRGGGRNAARLGGDRLRVLTAGEPCPTVVGALNRGSRQRRMYQVEAGGGRFRTLSWQEAAQVQGFPEDYLFAAGYRRAEKMVGQAIPIPVGRAILRAIVREGGDR